MYGSDKALMPKTMHKGPTYRLIFAQKCLKPCMCSGENARSAETVYWIMGKFSIPGRHDGHQPALRPSHPDFFKKSLIAGL